MRDTQNLRKDEFCFQYAVYKEDYYKPTIKMKRAKVRTVVTFRLRGK